MKHSRIKWTAVALFAAVMTIAEVVAFQAAARDARRWLASDSAREILQAGRAVARVVVGNGGASYGEHAVIRVKRGNPQELRASLVEAKACLRDVRKARERKRIRSHDEI
ncbi:MAG: hypothetical protein ABIS67_11105 [Candidatus Eisenbacteria bacterium]